MPRRTNSITKSRSKTNSRSRKSRSTSRRSRSISNSINRNSYKSKRSKSRRKYRGGCKTCENTASPSPGTWTSTGTMRGGSNPYQISKDIFSHVTDATPHLVA